jgi:hypothetical protein
VLTEEKMDVTGARLEHTYTKSLKMSGARDGCARRAI